MDDGVGARHTDAGQVRAFLGYEPRLDFGFDPHVLQRIDTRAATDCQDEAYAQEGLTPLTRPASTDRLAHYSTGLSGTPSRWRTSRIFEGRGVSGSSTSSSIWPAASSRWTSFISTNRVASISPCLTGARTASSRWVASSLTLFAVGSGSPCRSAASVFSGVSGAVRSGKRCSKRRAAA